MHGAILSELQKFVGQRYATGARGASTHALEIAGRIYMPIASYPDQEASALLEGAVRLSGQSAHEVLVAFGEHVAPRLIEAYRDLVKPSWRTLDMLENTEKTIHRIVRVREPKATPPRLACTRLSERQLLIAYSSPRRLCSLAIGLAKGVARHFGDSLDVSHRQCMNEGAESCVLDLRLGERLPKAS